jgi:hypothetical protein
LNTETITSTTLHEQVRMLLPWYVNGTLKGEEEQFVREHIKYCATCCNNIDLDQALLHVAKSIPATENETPDIDRAFARINHKLDTLQRESPVRQWLRQFYGLPGTPSRWMAWTVALQCMTILYLGFLLISPYDAPPTYRLLSGPKQDTANIVILFQPGTTIAELQRILRTNGANVVNGPTVTDAYQLIVPEAQLSQVIARLKTEPAVILAEPLTLQSGN